MTRTRPRSGLRTPTPCSINSTMSTVLEITDAIQRLDVKEQAALLRELPRHLKISPEDLAWAKVAEGAFDFWDNPEDAIYDKL